MDDAERRAVELLEEAYGEAGVSLDLGLKAEMMLQGSGPAIQALAKLLRATLPAAGGLSADYQHGLEAGYNAGFDDGLKGYYDLARIIDHAR